MATLNDFASPFGFESVDIMNEPQRDALTYGATELPGLNERKKPGTLM